MRLFPGEQLIGGVSLMATNTILLATSQGQIGRIDASLLRRCQRGDFGEIALQLEQDNDRIQTICKGDGLVGVITSQKRHGRLDANSYPCINPGERCSDQLNLNANEALSNLIPLLQSNQN